MQTDSGSTGSGNWHDKNKVTSHTILLKLNWRNKPPAFKLLDAKKKLDKMSNNPDFPEPWNPVFVSLAQYSTCIAEVDGLLLARSQKMPHSAKYLKAGIRRLHTKTRNIGAKVQLKMNDSPPDEAIRICKDAGFVYVVVPPRGKRKNSANPGNEPGTMIVKGAGAGRRMWQTSTDTGTTIRNLDATSGGIIIVNDLEPKSDNWFRFKLVFRKGRYGEWSNWFKGRAG